MDVDAVIRRAPELALVDELAHTNASGMRNQKRYQDIDEILDAGIDVISTVNVQHLESLNDAIFELTGSTRPRDVPRPDPRRGGRGRARRPDPGGAAGTAAAPGRSTAPERAEASRCRTSSAVDNLPRRCASSRLARGRRGRRGAAPDFRVLDPAERSRRSPSGVLRARHAASLARSGILRARLARRRERLGSELDALWVPAGPEGPSRAGGGRLARRPAAARERLGVALLSEGRGRRARRGRSKRFVKRARLDLRRRQWHARRVAPASEILRLASPGACPQRLGSMSVVGRPRARVRAARDLGFRRPLVPSPSRRWRTGCDRRARRLRARTRQRACPLPWRRPRS